MSSENREDKEVCAKCGGMCCRWCPGSCFPDDFKSEKEIIKALNTERYAIDWWDGDATGKDERDKTYYIRPAIKGREGRLWHPAWGGECTFLTNSGCTLEFDKRPKSCRMLIPNPNIEEDGFGSCTMEDAFDKQEACIEWLKYEKLFEKLKETSNEKD